MSWWAMPWWAWVALGAVLLVAEMFVVDLEFYLVFLGLSALITGGLALAGLPGPAWVPWLVFAAVALVSMVTFRRRLYDRIRGGAPGWQDGIVGSELRVNEAVAPGGTSRAELRGTTWTVRNVGTEPLAPGDRVRVRAADGLSLEVERAD